MKTKLLIITITFELLYLTASFWLAELFGQWSYQGEIIRGLLRLISIAVFSWIYCKHFCNIACATTLKSITTFPFIGLILLLLLFAVVYTNVENEPLAWKLVFAVSGLIAGFREEIIYRGILQNTLQQKYHFYTALFLTTAVFTLSHLQYIYYQQTFAILMIAIASIIFSCIFIYSGSILLTGFVHGLYDALLSINIVPIRVNNIAGFPILGLIMVLFLVLIRKKSVRL